MPWLEQQPTEGMLLQLVRRGQALLKEGDPCPDLEPGTFDWHTLRPTDPFPNGNSGQRVYCGGGAAGQPTGAFPPTAVFIGEWNPRAGIGTTFARFS